MSAMTPSATDANSSALVPPWHRGSTAIGRYGIAILGAAFATWFRYLLDPVLGSEFPFATLFFAVLCAAWYGGPGPALLAALAGGLFAAYFLLPPVHSFAVSGRDHQIGLVLFLFEGIGVALLGGAMASARRKAEKVAAIAREQSALIEQTYDPVLVWDWHGAITFWNKGAERLYGFTRLEALGRTSHDLLQTQFPTSSAAIEQRLETDGRWEGELTHTTRDGRHIIVESRMSVMRDAQRVRVIEANRDITLRKQADSARRAGDARLRAILDATIDGFIGIDQNGLVTTMSAAAERLFGYSQD